ncbi:MAG: response regulator [Myxococcales bacterium]|nr:response regulator [Myxococcales bacterium]
MAGELILVVEDNQMNAKLLRDVLGSRGYEVAESTTAEEGLEITRSRNPALVLMDIQLPGMNGIEALRELKKDPSTQSIPVIAVTASVMPMERNEVLEAGFDGYQTKPISVKELMAEVRRLLDGGSEPEGGSR